VDLGGLWASFLANPIVGLALRIVGLYLLLLYLATIFWTIRDAQRRIENPIVPYLAGVLAAVVPFLGVFAYLILRPSETLSEAYERQLAEESLLSEAETRIVCPTCHERVQEEWLLCPHCRTRLKRVCPSCAKLIRPEWNICPYCAKDFDERDWTVKAMPGGRAGP
jgi:RNA polymerase subunit RPABC4/transcription elongation factor Spt4